MPLPKVPQFTALLDRPQTGHGKALEEIHSGKRRELNWRSFSIAKDETTRFIQQSAASTVLNRVTGVDPSQILGVLQSNGRVFLINPNGIVFGAGAQIDTAGLVASTLNLSNQDFLAGRLRFTESGCGAARTSKNPIGRLECPHNTFTLGGT